MDIGSLLIGIAVIVLSILYITFPFLRKDQRVEKIQSSEKAEEHTKQNEESVLKLLQDRDRLIRELEELEYDFQSDKINSEDYPALKDTLLRDGAMIMHRLEESGYYSRDEEISVTDRKGFKRFQDTNDEFELLINHRRMERRERTSGFCPKCGVPLQKSDKFCPNCGALRDPESE